MPRRGYIVDEGQIRCRSELPPPQSEKPSIAILSFRPLASDREHHWFAEGLTEDIATELTRSRQLMVVSRLARPAEPDVSRSVAEVAGAFGVRHVVDGSIRLVRNCLRVSSQLIDAHSGPILWEDHFDRYLNDVFAIQDEITEAILRHLEIELLPEERRATHNCPEPTAYKSLDSRCIRFCYRIIDDHGGPDGCPRKHAVLELDRSELRMMHRLDHVTVGIRDIVVIPHPVKFGTKNCKGWWLLGWIGDGSTS